MHQGVAKEEGGGKMEAREPSGRNRFTGIFYLNRGKMQGGGGLRSIPTKTLQVLFELEKLSRVFLLEQRKLINFVGILR